MSKSHLWPIARESKSRLTSSVRPLPFTWWAQYVHVRYAGGLCVLFRVCQGVHRGECVSSRLNMEPLVSYGVTHLRRPCSACWAAAQSTSGALFCAGSHRTSGWTELPAQPAREWAGEGRSRSLFVLINLPLNNSASVSHLSSTSKGLRLLYCEYMAAPPAGVKGSESILAERKWRTPLDTEHFFSCLWLPTGPIIRTHTGNVSLFIHLSLMEAYRQEKRLINAQSKQKLGTYQHIFYLSGSIEKCSFAS